MDRERKVKQSAGYGTPQSIVAKFMDTMSLVEPLEQWDEPMLHSVVDAFLAERFPTMIVSATPFLSAQWSSMAWLMRWFQVLNKIDLPDSDLNVAKIMRRYGEVIDWLAVVKQIAQ